MPASALEVQRLCPTYGLPPLQYDFAAMRDPLRSTEKAFQDALVDFRAIASVDITDIAPEYAAVQAGHLVAAYYQRMMGWSTLTEAEKLELSPYMRGTVAQYQSVGSPQARFNPWDVVRLTTSIDNYRLLARVLGAVAVS